MCDPFNTMPQYVPSAPNERHQLDSLSMNRATARSFQSTRSLNMNDLEMQTDSLSGYRSMSGSNQGGLDVSNGTRPMMCDQTSPTTTAISGGPHTMSFPLVSLLNDPNPPWTLLRGSDSAYSNVGPSSSFEYYRNNAAHSDCGTTIYGIPSDSGYASMPKKSIGTPSIYCDNDHNTETQSLNDEFTNLFRQTSVQGTSQQPPGADLHRTPSVQQADNNNGIIACLGCHKPMKSKSELNKHSNRHRKPFVCHLDGCNRKGNGFSSQNDLSRHQQSVHRAPGQKYRCTRGQCRTKNKDWPRADNFKQHLKRVHKIEFTGGEDALKEFLVGDSDSHENSSQFKQTSMTEDLEFAGLGAATGSVGLISDMPFYWSEPERQQSERVSSSANPVEAGILQSPHRATPSPDDMFSLFAATHDSSPEQRGSSEAAQQVSMQLHGEQDLMPLETLGTPLPTEISSVREQGVSDKSCAQPDTTEHEAIDHIPAEALVENTMAESGAIPGDDPEKVVNPVVEHMEELTRRTSKDSSGDARPGVDCERDKPVEVGFMSPTSQAEDSAPGVDISSVTTNSRDTPKAESIFGPQSIPAFNSDDLKALLESLEKKGALPELIGKLGYQKVQEEDGKQSESGGSRASSSENRINCPHPGCKKAFQRKCELKKHMKRHEKPYGCTYPQCARRFGSKNDWKRHENSQHYQLEVWRCGENVKGRSNQVCGRVCHRRESFKVHLQKDHGIKENEAIEQLCSKNRVGRNGEARFWCGFCEKTIEIKKGPNAWDERFNHIGNHYNGGDKKDVADWKNIDTNPDDSVLGSDDLSRPASPAPNPRKRGGSDDLKKPLASKRAKQIDEVNKLGEPFWVCCHCSTSSSPWISSICAENGCGHFRCDDCAIHYSKITEKEIEIES